MAAVLPVSESYSVRMQSFICSYKKAERLCRYSYRNMFLCLTCLFEETAFCFLFLCANVGQTSITCSIDLKLTRAHSQVRKRAGGCKNIFSPLWVFCLGSIPKPFMAHKESAALSEVNWDQAMAETRADYRGRLSLLMSDESFQNHMI